MSNLANFLKMLVISIKLSIEYEVSIVTLVTLKGK